MTDRELMQQALEALEGLADYRYTDRVKNTMASLRQALAEPEQEPVAEVREDMKGGGYVHWLSQDMFVSGTKLYTAPTPRKPRHISYVCPQCYWSLDERKPLTDEEISAIDWKSNETLHDFARAIERAHGICK